MKKKLTDSLLLRILVAIALGIVCSRFFPLWAVRIFVTFNGIFSNFLSMFIPLLILGLVAPGIAELGRGAGRLLLITFVIAYVSTVLAGAFSYFTCKFTYPFLLGNSARALGQVDMSSPIAPYFTIEMPAFISVTTALVLAFVLGLALAAMESQALRSVVLDFRELVFLTVNKAIVPCLPVFIFGIFLKMGKEGNVAPVLGMFIKIIALIVLMQIVVLTLQFCIAGAVSGKNPFRSLLTMLPAYVTALGTQSSAATIPVTLSCAKKAGVKEDVADFTVPLCATIHMSGSMLQITACAYAMCLSIGLPHNLGIFFGFIAMLAITMVAAPGIPGGAIMAALGLLGSMLGFDANVQGLMIALYVALDSFGTACNVTGDGAVSLIVNKIAGARSR